MITQEFFEKIAAMSDTQLYEIIQNAAKDNKEEVLAALLELEKRGVLPQAYVPIKNKLVQQIIGSQKSKNKPSGWLGLLKPDRYFMITQTILYLNVLIFECIYAS